MTNSSLGDFYFEWHINSVIKILRVLSELKLNAQNDLYSIHPLWFLIEFFDHGLNVEVQVPQTQKNMFEYFDLASDFLNKVIKAKRKVKNIIFD